ncbi:LutC/YkgG family protein [Lapillicoccus jejuensis]|uniref:L-lactate dehydrogenase complex protein LldG n=1 Tax=Lapillicoccus jejuensis TaxID=402171 RepID=A0A542DWR6_9MICO|nr:LUD domain-containing protein [Lapillicoccus jejuensis]TQJ07532.1 L-lactate dehydrogenase complex protein LldG [Lapillicoccus jejuensis]
MSTAREDVLARVRSALRGAPTRADGPAGEGADEQAPGGGHGADVVDLVTLFVERVEDYRAVVVRTGAAGAAAAVRDGLAASRSVVVPAGFPDDLLALPDGARRVTDDPAAPLTAAALDGVDAVVTTATVGIAETGTIVLDHGAGQGRRALTLVPDRHVCVVRTDQVVADVPDAVAALPDPTRPLTWVSGPSATSDIELDRVEGVHGPRTLVVVVVG